MKSTFFTLGFLFLSFISASAQALCPCGISSNELTCASTYLFNKGIVDSIPFIEQNVNVKRQDLAKVSFIALYGSATEPTPADSSPTPFRDLQNNWVEYYKYAKALSYLEYGDGKSPFSRNFFNFRPVDGISRKLVCKVYCETFNIPLSTATTSLYADVNAAYGAGTVSLDELRYVETCKNINVITSGGNFRPNDLATRAEAFMILYRILSCHLNNAPPVKPDTANYFRPGNYNPFNFNNVPSISDANFDAYSKISFYIPGKNIPLTFEHKERLKNNFPSYDI
jgi:hypothetical protein